MEKVQENVKFSESISLQINMMPFNLAKMIDSLPQRVCGYIPLIERCLKLLASIRVCGISDSTLRVLVKRSFIVQQQKWCTFLQAQAITQC